MDLQLRFKDKHKESISNSKSSSNDPFERYAKKPDPQKNKINDYGLRTETRAQQHSSILKTIKVQIKNLRLNKYRIDANARAPDNQFKRYLLDTKNVFYEERPEISLVKKYEVGKWISAIGFLILFISSIMLSLVKPFALDCPNNAVCGVFPHCFEGYSYNEEQNRCEVSQQLLEENQRLAITIIQRLKQQYGQEECKLDTEDGKTPSANIDELLEGITQRDLRKIITQKLTTFLNDKKNQQQHGFSYYPSSRLIIPTQKKYSLACTIMIFLNSKGALLKISITLLIIIVPILIISHLKFIYRAKFLYKKLREKTLNEKMINVIYAKEDLEKKYGNIDERMWNKIDSYRHSDRDIVFVQDDFLYWQAL